MKMVIKFGSSLLANAAGELDAARVKKYCAAIAELLIDGHEVVVVSSGAILAGFKELGFSARPQKVREKQAAAAVGQRLLMDQYARGFAPGGRTVAQVLITRRDFFRRRSYEHARDTIDCLLRYRAVPIVNENDTVSVAEISFGDNDRLAALLAACLRADMLLLLTEAPGVLPAEGGEPISQITQIDENLLAAISGAGSVAGTGGMKSKVLSAYQASQLGVTAYIGGGAGSVSAGFLRRVIDQKAQGTYVPAAGSETLRTKKQWIAFHAASSGKVWVDEGAQTALCSRGRSLLAVGVTQVEGDFSSHEVIEVVAPNGKLLGRGEIGFSSDNLRSLIGQSDIPRETREVIHRDNWVAFEQFEDGVL